MPNRQDPTRPAAEAPPADPAKKAKRKERLAPEAPISIKSVLESGQDLYVRNILNPRTSLFITMYGEAGRPRGLVVPPTPHPFNVSDHFAEDVISRSEGLRDALRLGGLEIVPTKQALKELARPGVREELRLIERSLGRDSSEALQYRRTSDRDESNELGPDGKIKPQRVIRNAEDIPVLHAPPQVGTLPPDFTDDEAARRLGRNAPVRVQTSAVNPLVDMLVSQARENLVTAADARGKLAQISDQLTDADRAYLLANTTGALRKYAAELSARAAGLDAEGDEDEDEQDDEDETDVEDDE